MAREHGARPEPALPRPDAVCEGGDLDCGSGLLLIIRQALQPLAQGGVLEVTSREPSVAEDLPAWCRMVGHALLAVRPGEGRTTHYFLGKKGRDEALAADRERARGFRWQARVSWSGGMQARAHARNHTVPVGQPASFDTADPAPSAVELLLASLGGCLAVGFGWRASRAGLEVRQLELSLSASSKNPLVFLGLEDEGHPGLERLEGTLYVDSDADPQALDGVWVETLARSPVAQTILRKAQVAIEMKLA